MWLQAVRRPSACWLALFGLSLPPSSPSDTSREDDATALDKKLQIPIDDLLQR